ncbi:lateral organ boundaries domain-containing protein [Cynara cardunculus var. scolymus]|uniref:Lateral organ boundaries domain-containing protein n=1 Tax=Cynara cardunculus var. scolymus TaxID=59895 RepID=A0A118JTH7_CYNCS|nr:lateral organ boundaries domain-containing protein [Cynara cardunculus var. scolymus]
MSANPSTSHTGGGGGGGGSSSSGGPCGACKFLRRKCVAGCVFAPYFDSEQIGTAHFAAVHKVFGASNVSKLLHNIPVHKRLDAVVTVCYEAHARLRDPVHGCLAHLFALQQQAEVSYFQAHLATLHLEVPPTPPGFCTANLPTTASPPPIYDLSLLFDPMMQPPAARQMDHHQLSAGTGGAPPHQGGGGDLHALARELLQRQSTMASETSPLPPHRRGNQRL